MNEQNITGTLTLKHFYKNDIYNLNIRTSCEDVTWSSAKKQLFKIVGTEAKLLGFTFNVDVK